MHLETNIKHWSHHLHDDMLAIRHGIGEQLHHRHLWIGLAIALLILGLMTLLTIAVWHMPAGSLENYQYGYPSLYYPV
jgi:hypothetical protein